MMKIYLKTSEFDYEFIFFSNEFKINVRAIDHYEVDTNLLLFILSLYPFAWVLSKFFYISNELLNIILFLSLLFLIIVSGFKMKIENQRITTARRSDHNVIHSESFAFVNKSNENLNPNYSGIPIIGICTILIQKPEQIEQIWSKNYTITEINKLKKYDWSIKVHGVILPTREIRLILNPKYYVYKRLTGNLTLGHQIFSYMVGEELFERHSTHFQDTEYIIEANDEENRFLIILPTTLSTF